MSTSFRAAGKPPLRRSGGFPAAVIVFAALLLSAPLRAEDGYELWLRYRPEPDSVLRENYRALTARIHVPAGSAVLDATRAELARALPAITGVAPAWTDKPDAATLIVAPARLPAPELSPLGREGFALIARDAVFTITGASDLAVLRGVHHFLRQLQLGVSVAQLIAREPERVRVRIANHWDNPYRAPGFRNESVERGYAGDSIFDWAALPGRVDPRLHDWARLLAAMGLNGAAINNVNTAKRGLEGWRLLTTPYLPKLAALAGVLRPQGVRLFLSVNFFSPILIDRLPTADPLDPAVAAWWRRKADEIYAAIPDFGGFVVKADSEGEPGPLKYGRTHAEGANLIAAALAPHGGSVHWRAFVYDRGKGDRVVQAFEQFRPLDGAFAPNVFLQVKNGPLDFQVREPVSTTLAAMPATNQLLELQITQEYTGQDRHVCFLGSLWHDVLQFDTHACGPGSTLARLVSDRLHPGTRNGVVGVMNIGSDRNWTGHLFAQANTYAFGRLAWDPDLPPETIAGEWARLTFGRDPRVVGVVTRLLLASWRTYEDYTAPFGLGLVTRRSDHFVPDPANRTDYHGATRDGVGFDRTRATGTGYAAQFFPPWRERFESRAECPEDLLLMFHHVPYAHRLRSGETLVQSLYDRYYSGAARARGFVREWESLRGLVDDERFGHVLARLRDQADLADGWVGTMVRYWRGMSGVADARDRPLPPPYSLEYSRP